MKRGTKKNILGKRLSLSGRKNSNAARRETEDKSSKDAVGRETEDKSSKTEVSNLLPREKEETRTNLVTTKLLLEENEESKERKVTTDTIIILPGANKESNTKKVTSELLFGTNKEVKVNSDASNLLFKVREESSVDSDTTILFLGANEDNIVNAGTNDQLLIANEGRNSNANATGVLFASEEQNRENSDKANKENHKNLDTEKKVKSDETNEESNLNLQSTGILPGTKNHSVNLDTPDLLLGTNKENSINTDKTDLLLERNEENEGNKINTDTPGIFLGATGNNNEVDTMSDGKQKKAVVDQIYDQLANLFKSSDDTQILAMEFPGRVLDETTYHFDNDHSLYSNILKPQNIVEEEFRLTDDIYDVNVSSSSSGHIVLGPSGKRVSTEFDEALSSLIPKFDDFESLFNDRQAMRDWLLEKIEDEIDGEEFHGSRMAFYDKLSLRYQNARSTWETERVKKLEEAQLASNPSEALEEYAKWMAFNAAPKENELESLFDDLVVRGYYHEIKRILGYIDVASPAEVLEDIKSKMRESSMLSLDESETIYPVQMQPVSWSKSLSTDFKPEDLLLAPDSITDDLMSKLSDKVQLENEINQLKNQQTGDITAIEQKIKTAQTSQDDATKEMLSNFTEATFLALKIAYNAYLKKDKKNPEDPLAAEGFSLEKNEKLSNGQVVTDDDIKKFKEFQKKNITAQIGLDAANRELAFELEEKAKAESSDTKDSIALLQSQLDQLNLAIDSLKRIALSTGSTDTEGLVPDNRPTANEFFDIKIKSKEGTAASATQLNSSASFENTSVNVIFGSYGSSSDSESSDFKFTSKASDIDIEIGMRATKVTIQRGSWFSPEVLEASKNMYHTGKGNFNENFATYPVAFIVVKDVTLKYTFKAGEVDAASTYAHDASESGGGFLCFSHSAGKSSSKHSKSAYTGKVDNSVVIKIPGPQILMWILQKVPEDESEEYPAGKSAIPPGVTNLLKPKQTKEEKAT